MLVQLGEDVVQEEDRGLAGAFLEKACFRKSQGESTVRCCAREPKAAEERAPRLLHITLRQTDDEASDRRRLAELVQALRTYPGRDEVRLMLCTAQDEHTLSLGKALVTDGIELRLAPILRDWGELSVSPLR